MPSCTSLLGFEKSQRDYLGGWSAQGSSKAIHSRASEDALGESETALAFDEYMKNLQMSEEDRSKILEVLQSSQQKPEPREDQEFQQDPDLAEESLETPLMDEPSVQAEENPSPAKKKRGGQASIRTEKLGDDPWLNRSIIRESLARGYYVCLSGKRKIRTLHKLGLVCAMLSRRLTTYNTSSRGLRYRQSLHTTQCANSVLARTFSTRTSRKDR